MDLNIVTLEIADLITHFDYYDGIVSEIVSKTGGSSDEQNKIRNKSKEHLRELLTDASYPETNYQLRLLPDLSVVITAKIKDMKVKEVHALIDKLEKDAKKMKKLYKSLV